MGPLDYLYLFHISRQALSAFVERPSAVSPVCPVVLGLTVKAWVANLDPASKVILVAKFPHVAVRIRVTLAKDMSKVNCIKFWGKTVCVAYLVNF